MQIIITACALSLLIKVANSHYVIELDDSSFQSALDSNPSVMIDFYAYWCGHCTRFAPTYESLSESLHSSSSPTKLFRVDAYKYSSIRSIWEIHGFPTIAYFYKGELISRYHGDRTVKALKSFIKKKEKKFGLV